VKGQTRNTAN